MFLHDLRSIALGIMQGQLLTIGPPSLLLFLLHQSSFPLDHMFKGPFHIFPCGSSRMPKTMHDDVQQICCFTGDPKSWGSFHQSHQVASSHTRSCRCVWHLHVSCHYASVFRNLPHFCSKFSHFLLVLSLWNPLAGEMFFKNFGLGEK